MEVGKLWRCLVHFEAISMSSVLLSFALGIIAVIQALISLMYSCIEVSSLDICQTKLTSIIACHQ